MAATTSEGLRPSPGPPPTGRRRWRLSRPTRLAGLFLLLVWVGPVTFVQNDTWRLLRWFGAPVRATAETHLIPAGQALVLEPKTRLKLQLRDGSVVDGRYVGRALLDREVYASRFSEHEHSAVFVPFTLGETVRVALRDGREWTAPFAGYAELSLLLENPDGPDHVRVPFEFTTAILRESGDRIEPFDLTRAFQSGLLPSAEALVLEKRIYQGQLADTWGDAVRVPVDEIASVTAGSGSGGAGAGTVGLVVLGVVAFVVLIRALHVDSPKPSGCDYDPGWGGLSPGSMMSIQRTTQPFDRSRGCYVGDAIAMGDAGPIGVESGPATFFSQSADTAASSRLVR